MLGDANEELSKVSKLRNQNQKSELRTRFEDDYNFVRNQKFVIPKEEGEWESYTTNRPSTDAGKTINILASAHLSLKIALEDENEKQRKDLSKTERFPYGIISLRDSLFTGIPEALPLQPSMAWHAVVRGWLGVELYLFTDDATGNVIPHIQVDDIMNTEWISGSRGLLYKSSMRWASAEDVKDQYGEDVTPDTNGRVQLYTIWDKEEFGTLAVHSKASDKGDWLQKKEHGLGHIPSIILPVGSMPFIQSERHTDTLKDVGVSFAVNNRNLYETESRMGSYLLTMAGETAHAPLVVEWDSTKGSRPAELEGGRHKNAVVYLDVGVGQAIKEIATSEMKRAGYEFFQYLLERENIGGQTPIAFGQLNQQQTAAGINTLRHASLESILPPQNAMERVFKWLANEAVSQFKTGDFDKMELQGVDGTSQRFKMKVKPNDIDNTWDFVAKLEPNFPSDDFQNAGISTQLVAAGLMSKETARDKYNLADDTDLEQEKIDREKVYGVAELEMRRVAAALEKDGDEEGARFIMDAIEAQKEKARPPTPTGASLPAPPEGTVAAAAPNSVPGENDAPESIARRALNFIRRSVGGGE